MEELDATAGSTLHKNSEITRFESPRFVLEMEIPNQEIANQIASIIINIAGVFEVKVFLVENKIKIATLPAVDVTVEILIQAIEELGYTVISGKQVR